MSSRFYSTLAIVAANLAIFVAAHAETDAELRKRILTETKMNVVMELAVPAAEFKGDGDPTTIEIVFLTKKADGPSRVSDDGEVIFLYKASDKTQQKLITRAFEIRIARATSGT
ncbi:MAG TPA: hypothetical protein VK624_02215 [Steroidobacteraceae bacterium]|nr:hypothetical protein [Steroidobacteraceae bacterium]